MLRIAELLIHTDGVPRSARDALVNALAGPEDERCDNLYAAALSLHHEAGLDCADARELVGLDQGSCVATA